MRGIFPKVDPMAEPVPVVLASPERITVNKPLDNALARDVEAKNSPAVVKRHLARKNVVIWIAGGHA